MLKYIANIQIKIKCIQTSETDKINFKLVEWLSPAYQAAYTMKKQVQSKFYEVQMFECT
jgi:hypothetical protein